MGPFILRSSAIVLFIKFQAVNIVVCFWLYVDGHINWRANELASADGKMEDMPPQESRSAK